jgi:hypothetical protein
MNWSYLPVMWVWVGCHMISLIFFVSMSVWLYLLRRLRFCVVEYGRVSGSGQSVSVEWCDMGCVVSLWLMIFLTDHGASTTIPEINIKLKNYHWKWELSPQTWNEHRFNNSSQHRVMLQRRAAIHKVLFLKVLYGVFGFFRRLYSKALGLLDLPLN